MTVTQFVIGFGFTVLGYPVGVTLVQTIFSKVLGPRPQGLWMGLMTGAGCLSRALGPVFLSLVYTRWGTYPTFGITGATLIIAMVWLQLVYKRLTPLTAVTKNMNGQTDDPTKLDVEAPLVINAAPNGSQQEIEMLNIKSTIQDKD